MTIPAPLLYTQEKHFSVELAKQTIDVVSKPGLPDWDKLIPSTVLLAENVELKTSDRVILFGCHQGALCVSLARQLTRGHLCITDIDLLSLQMAEKTILANQVAGVEIQTGIELPSTQQNTFDVALIQVPKGRSLLRRWLVQAQLALHEQGVLYLAGSNKAGIQSVIKDASSLFGAGRILGYKKGNRIAGFENLSLHGEPPEWSGAPGIAPGTWIEFSIEICGNNFLIHSLPGIFSNDDLDEGTRLLLQQLKVNRGARVLDVGCGYGIIGMCAVLNGAGRVDLVDSNLLAIAASQENLTLNQINRATVFTGDLLNPLQGEKYDLILSNPPFHSGHAVDYQMAEALIWQAYQALNPGGQLMIVANRFIPYDRVIKAVFSNVERVAESQAFHVLSGLK